MPVARATYRVPAPPQTVAGILRDTTYVEGALARVGAGFRAPRRHLCDGDRVVITVRAEPGLRLPLRTTVDAVTPSGLRSSRPGCVRHDVRLSADGAGTRVEDVIRWTLPAGRRRLHALIAARAAELRDRVARLAGAGVVVATALLREGRVLAAQRTRPPALAGRWELPGGRVEPGESEADAVARECREELGAVVRVLGRTGTDLPIEAGLLRVHLAELVGGSPEPAPLEHAALRWVGPADLDELAWIDADRAVLPDLRRVLCRASGSGDPARG